MNAPNPRYELRGINHLALVCCDMRRTVDFYTGVLGMPLVKTVELPEGMGQHFFFDCGNGDTLAFFWFADGARAGPRDRRPAGRPDAGDLISAVGSMNHVAFDVPPERIEEYRERLVAEGIECSESWNHDDSEWGVAPTVTDGVFVRSVYFQDPDGILLELACCDTRLAPRPMSSHEPKTAADRRVPASH